MAKKSFKGSIDPLDTLIGGPAPAEQPKEPAAPEPVPAAATVKQHTPPPGYKVNPLYVEKRDRRKQILITASTSAKLEAKAKAAGQSVNDLINKILEAALEE